MLSSTSLQPAKPVLPKCGGYAVSNSSELSAWLLTDATLAEATHIRSCPRQQSKSYETGVTALAAAVSAAEIPTTQPVYQQYNSRQISNVKVYAMHASVKPKRRHVLMQTFVLTISSCSLVRNISCMIQGVGTWEKQAENRKRMWSRLQETWLIYGNVDVLLSKPQHLCRSTRSSNASWQCLVQTYNTTNSCSI